MSTPYITLDASTIKKFFCDTFIFSASTDERAYKMAEIIKGHNSCLKNIIILKYGKISVKKITGIKAKVNIQTIEIDQTQNSFLKSIKKYKNILSGKNILIDISCIHIPEIFTILKYFKLAKKKPYVEVAYSFPFDYDFSEAPFTSYHSYYGNLKTNDLPGYGGIADGNPHSQIIIFFGFEGELSSKITEDIQSDKLVLVNNFPSFFQKYKDISIINNYDLLSTRHIKFKNVPADNPFETYNFLEVTLKKDENACIAPLGTKPVALGICLYALTHKNIRVVYPTSEQYNPHSTNKVLYTYIYRIPRNII